MPSIKRVTPNEDFLTKVLKVFELAFTAVKKPGQRVSKPFSDVYSIAANAEYSHIRRAQSIGKLCVELTNQSLSSRRYEEAAKLLWILCQDSSVFDTFLFKAMMLVLENLQIHDRDEIVVKFLSEVQNLPMANKKEVQLEYIIYGLRNSVLDVLRRSQDLISQKKHKSRTKNKLLSPTLEAYCAFLDYVEWSYVNVGDTQASQAKRTADKAILSFQTVLKKPGDWDIFVLKLVEMLDFSDRGEEIEDVLIQYAECNPSNLNAHIYLCTYLSKYAPDSEKLIVHLKIIADLSPSDERVILLLEKISSEDKAKKCLKIIFTFLDYPTNGKNIKAWEMLQNTLFLTNTRDVKNEKDYAARLWNSRYSSWKWLYFNPSQVGTLKETDTRLVCLRLCVLSFFDHSNVYIGKVLLKFPLIFNMFKTSEDGQLIYPDNL